MSRLELNARSALRVRQYEFSFPVLRPLTLLYASDLHLTAWKGHVARQLVEVAQRTKPDHVLLGGDLADTRGGLNVLADAIRHLRSVVAIPGNHERWLGMDRVRDSVESAGGHWLPGHDLEINGLQLGSERGDIVCAHDPAVFPKIAAQGTCLVLAGHLHGGQVVLAEANGRLYPGGWFFRWNGDHFMEGNSTLLVSRGMNDTLPIRWNCPRDVIVCRLSPSDLTRI